MVSAMTDEIQEYSLLCSACYTPCTGAEAHVIPHWNATMGMVVTTYRCGQCWIGSLAAMRDAVRAKDAETIRAAEHELQQTWLIRVIEAGELVFKP